MKPLLVKRKMIIYDESNKNIRLRTIKISDIEFLRLIKNSNRYSFFDTRLITANQQKKWFKNYLRDKLENLFIVEEKINETFFRIGSMGYKESNNFYEIYNVIRSRKSQKKVNKLKSGLDLMTNYLQLLDKDKPVFCKVLKNNQALEWYIKNGFRIVRENSDYYNLKLLIKAQTTIVQIEGD